MFQGGKMMNDTFMKEKPVLPLILSMSLPMVLSMLVNSLYNIVDSFFVAQISEEAMTALSLVYPVQNFINAAGIGFGVGINAVIAFCLGAGEHQRVSQIFKIVLCMSGIIMVFGTVICLLIPGQLMGLFTHTEATIQAGETALRIIGAGLIVSAVSVTASGALEGLGKGIPSLLISLCRYVVVIIPAAFLLSRFFGAVGVWNAFWITEAITAIISLFIYRKAITGP